MALTEYLTLTAALLQSPGSPIPLIPTATLTDYINIARNQVAADAECIRAEASLVLASGVQGYVFSALVVGVVGTGSVLNIRSARIGSVPLDIRAWEWFVQYYLGSGASGTPVRVAQQGQGTYGTLFFDPTPNATFSASFDTICLPIALVDDTTAESIPRLWTDAVPFYAAWLGYMSAQRQADAEAMMGRYRELVRKGRATATPSELPDKMPGGMGAKVAAAHTTPGAMPQAPGNG